MNFVTNNETPYTSYTVAQLVAMKEETAFIGKCPGDKRSDLFLIVGTHIARARSPHCTWRGAASIIRVDRFVNVELRVIDR